MSVRNLDRLFKPTSLALIGASKRPDSVGRVVARNLFNGGFDGPIMPVHPKHPAIEGTLAYPSVADLPIAPDLAVICTPPDSVPELVAELGARGTRAAVVITAGFGEGGNEAGAARRQRLLDAARPHTLRIVGPNCVGVLLPRLGIDASFSHIAAAPGDLAFLTQSGAMVTAMLDWAAPRGIGFSQVVSLGDMTDVDFGDLLDYLAVDPGTRAILLYVEGVTNARKFMSACRAASRAKPVIVIKGGRHAEGAKAASSHTGALAGSDAVYEAAFRRAGALRVQTLEELFDAAETLATASPARRGAADRLAILTNGGGPGVLATDALIDQGGRLAELAPETIATLDAALPATWSRGNPVDIIGDAPGSRYSAALEALLADPGVDAVLVMNCPTAVADPGEAAGAVIETVQAARAREIRRPVFTNWLGDPAAQASRRLFAANRLPTYDTPERAIRAVMHLVRYRRGQEELLETVPSIPEGHQPDTQGAREILRRAQDEQRTWLTEPEAKRILECYGIPTVRTRTAATVDEAVQVAGELGYPVALKILSPDITHKSDIGGVALDLESEADLRTHGEAILRRAREAKPDARIDGFSVQEMCRRPGAIELILGLVEDHQFGPAVLFGQGGTAVEVVKDKAIGLPPLNLRLARSLMAETRIYRLLSGYRDTPPADLEAIALALVRLSELAAELAEVAEVDINPLLADSKGVIALDARVKVKPKEAVDPTVSPAARLAIRPYPKALEQEGTLLDGTTVKIRPVKPEDEPAVQELYRHLTPEDMRLRFFAPKAEIGHESAARMTQIDYDREMALVGLFPDEPGQIFGLARIAADPDGRTAEYAVAVRSAIKGRGLGFLLMRRILDYAQRRGIKEVHGDVLTENRRMLQICGELGFERRLDPQDSQVVKVVKTFE
ncbi:acetyltransferase [Tistlia consotensis]|uniref:Acetyltransferase n=1 Tax=Tistlia consotensis USBA 355 TaxID=560819 RepID=A0A1Y6BDA6_9PROT|nr:bifunctional acetate--CoA ligase family protein/GNAT family N-acetyltransferase [Tistlia consotensis]SME94798.1 acetyltransferase [Tistlia consotensis USBA 355]SNR29568.1 acetyltransferase [Tistlia consotensis]